MLASLSLHDEICFLSGRTCRLLPNGVWCAETENAISAGDGNVNGFGLEFYIETPGNEIAETIHDVKKSWQFQLLYTVSQLAAGISQL